MRTGLDDPAGFGQEDGAVHVPALCLRRGLQGDEAHTLERPSVEARQHRALRGHESDRAVARWLQRQFVGRSEEHTSELQSLMRISYAVFCLKHKNKNHHQQTHYVIQTTQYPANIHTIIYYLNT